MKIDFLNISLSIRSQPKEIRDTIFSEKGSSVVFDISKEFNLDEEKTLILNDNICYVLLGFSPKDDFRKNISIISSDKTILDKIDDKVQKEIFLPLTTILSNRKPLNILSENKKSELSGLKKEKDEEKIINLIPELDQNIKKIINDRAWKKRVSEISAKYSLSEEQDTILRNLVLFVVIGVEEPETFKDSVKKELIISDLLADQIVEEIDSRVFQYIFNQISEETTEEKPTETKNEGDLEELRTMAGDIEAFKDGNTKEKTNNIVVFAPTLSEKPKQPEVKTEPVKEQIVEEDKFKMVGNNFAPPNLPGVEIEEPKKSFLDMGITTKTTPPKPQETVQKPMIGVPRYTASPEALEKESEPEQKPSFDSIAESKLNSTVSSQKEPPKTEIPNKYSVDPYREPLE